MTDPVAEAAAQLAAQAATAEPSIVERIVEGMHNLEAQVEHLIHPDVETKTYSDGTTATGVAPLPELSPLADTPGNAPAVAEASATEAATAEGAGGAAVGEPASAAPEVMSGAVESATVSASESPNADASTPPAGDATDAAGDLPNAASVAVEPTTALGSASNAAGASITSTTSASSAELPLHARIADHLESIYTLARDHSIATETAATKAAASTKTHIGDILHRMSNGMAVTEGELVQKLEALYRML